MVLVIGLKMQPFMYVWQSMYTVHQVTNALGIRRACILSAQSVAFVNLVTVISIFVVGSSLIF